MRLALALLLAATEPPSTAEIVRALVNDAKMAELAYRIEYHQKVRGPLKLAESNEARASQLRTLVSNFVDPWGTPYVIEVTGNDYRIVSAGSDRKLDRASWSKEGHYYDLAEDVVVVNGARVRSTRTFVADALTEEQKRGGGDLNAALMNAGSFEGGLSTPGLAFRYTIVLEGKRYFLKDAVAVDAHRIQETKESMVILAVRLQGYRGNLQTLKRGVVAALREEASPLNVYLYDADEWGTPFRIDLDDAGGYRIVSAGADRELQPATWEQAAENRPSEDMVLANGRWVREVSGDAYLQAELAKRRENAPPVKREARMFEGKPLYLVGGNVKAPIAISRPEPKYPAEMKDTGRGGLIIAELTIDDQGAVRDVRIVKSLGEAFDREATAALRQWKFRPGMLEGEAVAVIFTMTLKFDPATARSPAPSPPSPPA